MTRLDWSAAIIRDPLSISPSASALEAIALMSAGGNVCDFACEIKTASDQWALQAQRSCVLVLEEGQLVGMLTDRDFVQLSATHLNLAELTIADIMVAPVATLKITQLIDLFVPLKLFQQYSTAHLPLVDDHNKVVGLITSSTMRRLLRPIDLLQTQTASDIMTVDVVHASPEATLVDLTQLMMAHRVSSVVIVEGSDADANGLKPLGIVTERDIIQFLALELNFSLTQAQVVMSNPVFSMRPHSFLWSIQTLMHERQINRVVITGPQGCLEGIVTQTHLLNALHSKDIYQIAETLEQKISRLEAEKLTLLQLRNEKLELQVQARTAELQLQAQRERRLAQRAQSELKERQRVEALLAVQNAVLERIAKAEPLKDVLYDLASSMEMQLEEGLVAILLCDSSGHLGNAVAPHLPHSCLGLVEGIPVAEGAGSCGTAAFRGEQVVVEDIATDPLWNNYRELALSHGLRACWSKPIMANDGQVLGTYAVYFRTVKALDAKTLEDIAKAANIAGIAIERAQAQLALAQLNQDLEQKVQARTAALQQSDERWNLALQGTSDAIWDWDVKTHQVFYSRQWEAMRGCDAQDVSVPLTEWCAAIHPEDYAPTMALFDAHLMGLTEFYAAEYRVLHQDGSYVWILDRGRALRNRTGQVVRMAGSKTDISDRKKSEQIIHQQAQQETLLREITQYIRQSLDLQTTFQTACEVIRQFLHVDRVSIFKFDPASQFEGGEFVAESVIVPYQSVLKARVHVCCFGNYCDSGIEKGQCYAVSDIYDENIKTCYRDMLLPFQVRANLAMPLLCGDELWGLLCIHQCTMPRQWLEEEQKLTQQIANQLAIAIQQTNLFEQLQQELLERQQAQALLTETNQKLALSNDELARATRLKDEFLANMSHELRTPLNAILGISEAMQDGILGPLNERQKQSLSTVENSGQHLLALINDILDVAKIEAGRLELEISTVSISHLCNSSLAFVRQQALQKQIQLQVSQLAHLSDITVDERRMRQVLINLLTNAVKFTPVGGRVTLEVYLEPQAMNLAERVSLFRPKPIRSGHFDKYVHFSTLPPELEQSELCFAVRDTGIGIPESFRQKLFQPFVQVDSSLNRQYEGTGLGLTLVKQIAELHGGSVELESEPGRGSCFTVRLPASCIEPTALLSTKSYMPVSASAVAVVPRSMDINAEQDDLVELSHESPLILLAEDSVANVTTISSYLNAKGFHLEWAKNGEEAIALTKALRPDLILMDIQMPGVNGLDAIRVIRQEDAFREVPIVALTALAMKEDRERCLAAGANEYLSKPVKLKQLVATIHQLLHAVQC